MDLACTKRRGRRCLALACACSIGSTAHAQRAPIAVRPLGQIVATAQESFARVPSVRQLSDGHLLVNDAGYAHVYLYDTALAQFTLVPLADAAGRFAEMIGVRPYGLLPYSGDSTLFVDARSIAFLVVDPNGRIARVIAPPRPRDLMYFSQPGLGDGTFDGAGHFVYFPLPPVRWVHSATRDGDSTRAPPDSAPLIRVDIRTAAVDTIAQLRLASTTMMLVGSNGMVGSGVRDPLPIGDAWALLPGGTVAVIRAQDYHIDLIDRDGTRRATPPIAHRWVRITDSMKVAVLDSVRAADSLILVASRATGGRGPGGIAGSAGAGGGAAMAGSSSSDGGGLRMSVAALMAEHVYADPSTLPDYRSAFIGTAQRVDADGRIWILTDQPRSAEGGAIYDVVDHAGTLVDRVQIPGGCTLVGFGPGVAYLTSREGTGVKLARARIR